MSKIKNSKFGKISFTVVTLACLLILAPKTGFAQENASDNDLGLARKYAPVLYFHPAELFRPQSVEVMFNTARLQQQRRVLVDVNILAKVFPGDLFNYREENYFLDVWYGDEGTSDYKNYTLHRSYYENVLSPDAGGPPIVAYAHVFHDEIANKTVIQYWLFYFYNDWFNKHEGDWEMVQVVLDENETPESLVFSQHHGGTRRSWNDAQIEDDSHPAAYVALGSHATYFWGDEIYPNGQDVGNLRIEIMDRTGSFGRIIPDILLLPEREEVSENPTAFQGMEWVLFKGNWGQIAGQSDFGGPLGPFDKGLQWENPYDWGMAQPMDTDSWYKNRLRIHAVGEGAEEANISLHTDNDIAISADVIPGQALLHADPPEGAAILANLTFPENTQLGLVVSVPEAADEQVKHYQFNALPQTGGTATLTIPPDSSPSLVFEDHSGTVVPDSGYVESVPWDVPDLVWLVGVLPAGDVARGILISLVAGMLPTLVYLGAVYWADRYEREPAKLLATAFFWGAIPALVISIVVRVFYRLPIDMLGPEAIEALQAGIVAPIVEELLKGAVILYIAVRYRREFDNVLDGIIYGAMTGLGFAMMANIVSYLVAFAVRGFAGLNLTILTEGLLFGLNHAFYSSIIGAGLGYARMTRDKRKRVAIPLGALVLAIVTHALHNLAIQNTIGLSIFSFVVTWVGVIVIVVIMTWSLQRQQGVIRDELEGVIPDNLYYAVSDPGTRFRIERDTLTQKGFSAWRNVRHIHQLCAELAFKRVQARYFPEEDIALEVEELREEILRMMGGTIAVP